MNTHKKFTINLCAFLIALWAGNILIYSRTNTSMDYRSGAYRLSELEKLESEAEQIKQQIVTRPSFPDYENLRFKGKTKAQIDSIKRLDKEKQRFFKEFLGLLYVVGREINHRDSLSVLLYNAIVSGDSILSDDLLTPEFADYSKDAIVGSPYEIAFYNSLYDDLVCRNDSCDIFGKYKVLPMLDSRATVSLYSQIDGDSLYSKTITKLRDRLCDDIKKYLYLYDLDPFSVEADSVKAIFDLASTGPDDPNNDIIYILAETIATRNAVYAQLKDVRNLRNPSENKAPSLYTVRLVEMKLRLEDNYIKFKQLKKPDTEVMMEINKKLSPAENIGNYDVRSLHKLLPFLLKNEWEKIIETE